MPSGRAEMLAHREWTYRAFGILWASEFEWPGVSPSSEAASATVTIQMAGEADLLERWSGAVSSRGWPLLIDGRPLVVQKGVEGDFLLIHDRGGRFHLNADATVISCVVPDQARFEWQRVLLDTVLWTTALIHGFEALHASAVQNGDGVIAFVSSMGGGKTSLALEFLRRGYKLFCDDVLTLERRDGDLVAHASPPLVNVPVSFADRAALPVHEIARLGDEVWSAAEPAESPARVSQLFLLERSSDSDRDVSRSPVSGLELRLFSFVHGLVESREQARFDVCSDLAQQVPTFRLRADLDATPDELADLVETALGRVPEVVR